MGAAADTAGAERPRRLERATTDDIDLTAIKKQEPIVPITPLPELLEEAEKGGYAVGYFESWDVYSLEAVVDAAVTEASPVIIGIGGLSANHDWLRSRGIELYGGVAHALARRAPIPVTVLFNEADSFEEAAGALGAGYDAVMMHTQGWPWDKLIADTAALTATAHAVGVAVEGEVGALAEMRDGALDTADANFTSVDEATEFVAMTSVDCLAVAVGNVHFVTDDFEPRVDIDRIRDIRDAVDVPLVLHGGSGTPDDQTREAITAGIAKINVGTRLKRVFGDALTDAISAPVDDPNLRYGSRLKGDANLAAATAFRDEVRRLMNVFGSSGKASR